MKNLKLLSKRGLALFAALVMCVGLTNITAFASGEDHVHGEGGWTCQSAEVDDAEACTLEEHAHGIGCESILVCEDEDEEHEHAEVCWQQCTELEHTHGDGTCDVKKTVWTCTKPQEPQEPQEPGPQYPNTPHDSQYCYKTFGVWEAHEWQNNRCVKCGAYSSAGGEGYTKPTEQQWSDFLNNVWNPENNDYHESLGGRDPDWLIDVSYGIQVDENGFTVDTSGGTYDTAYCPKGPDGHHSHGGTVIAEQLGSGTCIDPYITSIERCAFCGIYNYSCITAAHHAEEKETTANLTISKNWVGVDDLGTLSATIAVYDNGVLCDTVTITGNNSASVSYVDSRASVCKDCGKVISSGEKVSHNFTVEEVGVSGAGAVNGKSVSAENFTKSISGTSVTNTYKPETPEHEHKEVERTEEDTISVSKTWANVEDASGLTATIELYDNGGLVDTYSVTGNGSSEPFTYATAKVTECEECKEIISREEIKHNFEVREASVSGTVGGKSVALSNFDSTVDGTAVTNTYKPETPEHEHKEVERTEEDTISVSKTWANVEDASNLTATIELYDNGGLVGTYSVTGNGSSEPFAYATAKVTECEECKEIISREEIGHEFTVVETGVSGTVNGEPVSADDFTSAVSGTAVTNTYKSGSVTEEPPEQDPERDPETPPPAPGTTTPTPTPTGETIPDDPVPQADPVTADSTVMDNETGNSTDEEIEDEEPPLAAPEAEPVEEPEPDPEPEEEEILDDGVPLAKVPQTGDLSVLWYAATAMSALGLTVLGRKREED